DLRVQFLDLSVRRPCHIRFLFKHCGKLVDSLLLPGVDHRLVQAVLRPKLRDRQLAFDRLDGYFCFEFRAVALAGRLAHQCSSFLKGRAKLNQLSDSRGPALTPTSTFPADDEQCEALSPYLHCPVKPLWDNTFPTAGALFTSGC